MAWRRRAPIWPPRELGRELGWRRRCRLWGGRRAGSIDGGSFLSLPL
jgi:hypothetical protein